MGQTCHVFLIYSLIRNITGRVYDETTFHAAKSFLKLYNMIQHQQHIKKEVRKSSILMEFWARKNAHFSIQCEDEIIFQERKWQVKCQDCRTKNEAQLSYFFAQTTQHFNNP